MGDAPDRDGGRMNIFDRIKEQEEVTTNGGEWLSGELQEFITRAYNKCKHQGHAKSTTVLRAFSEDQLVSMYAKWKVEQE